MYPAQAIQQNIFLIYSVYGLNYYTTFRNNAELLNFPKSIPMISQVLALKCDITEMETLLQVL